MADNVFELHAVYGVDTDENRHRRQLGRPDADHERLPHPPADERHQHRRQPIATIKALRVALVLRSPLMEKTTDAVTAEHADGLPRRGLRPHANPFDHRPALPLSRRRLGHSPAQPAARTMKPNPNLRRQRGATLIIALISLVILSIGALALMRSTSTSLFMAGNLAFKRDVANQAERAIAAGAATTCARATSHRTRAASPTRPRGTTRPPCWRRRPRASRRCC